MNKYKSGEITILEISNLAKYREASIDPEVDLVVFDKWQEGLIKYPTHISFRVKTPEKIEDYLGSLNKKDRYYVKKYVKDVNEKFEVRIVEKINHEQFKEWYKGYVDFIDNKKFGKNRIDQEWLKKYEGQTNLIAVYHKGNIIGGCLFMIREDRISMSFAWYSDLLKQNGGGTSIIYNLIEKCIEYKRTYFSFGRDPNLFGGSISLGLHHFKESMGGVASLVNKKYKGALFQTKKHLIYYEINESDKLIKVELN